MAREVWQPKSNEESQNQCHGSLYDRRKHEAYGRRPLAETEEAHGLMGRLREVFGELGGRRLKLVRTEEAAIGSSRFFRSCRMHDGHRLVLQPASDRWGL